MCCSSVIQGWLSCPSFLVHRKYFIDPVTLVGRFCVPAFPGGLEWIFMVRKLYLTPELSTLGTLVAPLPNCQLRCFPACHRGFFMLRRELRFCCDLAASALSWSHSGKSCVYMHRQNPFFHARFRCKLCGTSHHRRLHFPNLAIGFVCLFVCFSNDRFHVKPAGPRDDWKARV